MARRTDLSTPTGQDIFWSRVRKTDTCWVWQGATAWKGYGSFKINGHSRAAHRLAYEVFVGEIPAGLWVLHRCDNPPCVRPEHLFLGTPRDNYLDARQKGRISPPNPAHVNQAFGSRIPNAKLTDVTVVEIRGIYAAGGVTMRELAVRYGVHKSTIVRAIGRTTKRKNWRHVA